jgi:chromosome segregation ATPase
MTTEISKEEQIKLLESWIETLDEDLQQFQDEVDLRLNEKRDRENYYKKQLERYISRVAAAQKRVDGKKAQIRKVQQEIESLQDESSLHKTQS